MDLAALHRSEEAEAVEDARGLGSEELDRRIRAGWEEWCDLLEGMVGTGGMLPSRELAGRVVTFFEDAYWRAEEARVETLRRHLAAEGLRCRRRGLDRARGIG